MVVKTFRPGTLSLRMYESLLTDLPQQVLMHPEAVALEHPDIVNANLAHPPMRGFADIVDRGQCEQVEEVYRAARRFGISPAYARSMRKVVAEKLDLGTHPSIVNGAFYLGGDDESIVELFVAWMERGNRCGSLDVLADLGKRGSVQFGACYLAYIEHYIAHNNIGHYYFVELCKKNGLWGVDPVLDHVSGCMDRFYRAVGTGRWDAVRKEMDFAEATGLVQTCSQMREVIAKLQGDTVPEDVLERAVMLPGDSVSLIGVFAKIINTQNRSLLERIFRNFAHNADRPDREAIEALSSMLVMEISMNAGSAPHPSGLIEAGALLARDLNSSLVLLGILVGRFDLARIGNVLAAWRDLSADDIGKLEAAVVGNIAVLCENPQEIFSSAQGMRIVGDVSHFSLLGLEMRNDYSDDDITRAYAARIAETHELETVAGLWLGECSLEPLRKMIGEARGALSTRPARRAYIRQSAERCLRAVFLVGNDGPDLTWPGLGRAGRRGPGDDSSQPN